MNDGKQQDPDLDNELQTVDIATDDNMKKLEEVGERLQEKNIIRVNLETGEYKNNSNKSYNGALDRYVYTKTQRTVNYCLHNFKIYTCFLIVKMHNELLCFEFPDS